MRAKYNDLKKKSYFHNQVMKHLETLAQAAILERLLCKFLYDSTYS